MLGSSGASVVGTMTAEDMRSLVSGIPSSRLRRCLPSSSTQKPSKPAPRLVPSRSGGESSRSDAIRSARLAPSLPDNTFQIRSNQTPPNSFCLLRLSQRGLGVMANWPPPRKTVTKSFLVLYLRSYTLHPGCPCIPCTPQEALDTGCAREVRREVGREDYRQRRRQQATDERAASTQGFLASYGDIFKRIPGR